MAGRQRLDFEDVEGGAADGAVVEGVGQVVEYDPADLTPTMIDWTRKMRTGLIRATSVPLPAFSEICCSFPVLQALVYGQF